MSKEEVFTYEACISCFDLSKKSIDFVNERMRKCCLYTITVSSNGDSIIKVCNDDAYVILITSFIEDDIKKTEITSVCAQHMIYESDLIIERKYYMYDFDKVLNMCNLV